MLSIKFKAITWSDAVDHSNESISIPPAWTKVSDLTSPKLSRHLSLHPLQQGFLGTQFPFLLGLLVDASLSDGSVIISAASIATPNTGTSKSLAKLLKNTRVLLDLKYRQILKIAVSEMSNGSDLRDRIERNDGANYSCLLSKLGGNL